MTTLQYVDYQGTGEPGPYERDAEYPYMSSYGEPCWNRNDRSFHSVKFHLIYQCPGCEMWRPWCDGGTDTELCDWCWAGQPQGGGHGCSHCGQGQDTWKNHFPTLKRFAKHMHLNLWRLKSYLRNLVSGGS